MKHKNRKTKTSERGSANLNSTVLGFEPHHFLRKRVHPTTALLGLRLLHGEICHTLQTELTLGQQGFRRHGLQTFHESLRHLRIQTGLLRNGIADLALGQPLLSRTRTLAGPSGGTLAGTLAGTAALLHDGLEITNDKTDE